MENSGGKRGHLSPLVRPCDRQDLNEKSGMIVILAILFLTLLGTLYSVLYHNECLFLCLLHRRCDQSPTSGMNGKVHQQLVSGMTSEKILRSQNFFPAVFLLLLLLPPPPSLLLTLDLFSPVCIFQHGSGSHARCDQRRTFTATVGWKRPCCWIGPSLWGKMGLDPEKPQGSAPGRRAASKGPCSVGGDP